MNKVLFSRKSDEWQTPIEFFKQKIGGADFDPCAGLSNLCKENNHIYNGLEISWEGYRKIFINPPYSNIDAWVKKALYEMSNNKTTNVIYFLVPSRTDTKWFQQLWHLQNHNADLTICTHFDFIAGRLHFSNSKNAAPFPSVLITIFTRAK